MNDAQLSHARRASDLARLQTAPLDILVIGGGVVGAGVALDAATRGLSVGVVEARDWASGTSSQSTKLIHGGLRYLRMLDFNLIREALRERGLLLDRIAPHLVRKVRFLYPLRHRVIERAYTAFGIAIYDALATSKGNARGVPRQRQVSKSRLYAESPGLAHDQFVGAIEYYDAQVDDARYVVTLVRTAASLGAVAVNRVAAVALLREGGAVIGARLADRETGAEFDVLARTVILATGVWTPVGAEDGMGTSALPVHPSKGVHFVVASDKIALASAVVVETEKSVLFIIPWRGHWIVGTTDTAWLGDPARPVATEGDLTYLLDHVNEILEIPLGLEDIDAVYAGVRPLVAAAPGDTTKISREHAVDASTRGLVAVSGGKFTTYRVMAEDVVDAALRQLSTTFPLSATASTPLLGAPTIATLDEVRAAVTAGTELPGAVVDRLIGRYGSLVTEVLAAATANPTLLAELPGGAGYLAAEAHYAATHEGALHLEDVIHRRLRLDLESDDHGLASAPMVAAIIGAVLGWSRDREHQELEHHRELATAERRARSRGDDQAASEEMAALSTWDAIPPIL